MYNDRNVATLNSSTPVNAVKEDSTVLKDVLQQAEQNNQAIRAFIDRVNSIADRLLGAEPRPGESEKEPVNPALAYALQHETRCQQNLLGALEVAINRLRAL